MTTSPHTLEEKIGEYVGIAVTDGSKGGLAVRKLLALFKSTVEEVIIKPNEKIKVPKDFDKFTIEFGKHTRNSLRMEQRQALEDIISGKKGL